MYKVGDEVVLPLKIEKICNEELVGAKSEEDVTYLFKIEEANRVLKPGESKTYEQGLEDAMEILRKVKDLSVDEREKILGYKTLEAIIADLTMEYVAEQLEAYEKEIKVGDVVRTSENGFNAVVMRMEKGIAYVMYDDESGDEYSVETLTKIGKHIDIAGLLRQIGE